VRWPRVLAPLLLAIKPLAVVSRSSMPTCVLLRQSGLARDRPHVQLASSAARQERHPAIFAIGEAIVGDLSAVAVIAGGIEGPPEAGGSCFVPMWGS
jgi:hypothetical protein